jgi:hypothetical protein
MNDTNRSNARIAALIEAYADRAPTDVDPASTARSAVAQSERSMSLVRLLRGRRATAAPGRANPMQPMLRLGAAVAAVIVAVAAVALVTRPSTTPGQSSSPAPSAGAASVLPSDAAEAAPGAGPVEFSGAFECGPPVRQGTAATLDVGADGMTVTQSRNGAWEQAIEMTDPRLEGTVYHTYEWDAYAVGIDEGARVGAATHRIENDEGAWESRAYGGTFADGTPIGEPTQVLLAPTQIGISGNLVGEGGYAGLVAVLMVTDTPSDCRVEVRGMIFDAAPAPQPYIPG